MPKYFEYKVCGYYLYYTAKCIVEAFHVHASDSRLTEEGSAKFFVHADGSTVVQKKGILSQQEINKKILKIICNSVQPVVQSKL